MLSCEHQVEEFIEEKEGCSEHMDLYPKCDKTLREVKKP